MCVCEYFVVVVVPIYNVWKAYTLLIGHNFNPTKWNRREQNKRANRKWNCKENKAKEHKKKENQQFLQWIIHTHETSWVELQLCSIQVMKFVFLSLSFQW